MMQISLQEIDQRITDIERRTDDAKYLIHMKQQSKDALENLGPCSENATDEAVLRTCVSVLRVALLSEYTAGIQNLETLVRELESSRRQLQAIKFGGTIGVIA